jgi:hypothetical protein
MSSSDVKTIQRQLNEASKDGQISPQELKGIKVSLALAKNKEPAAELKAQRQEELKATLLESKRPLPVQTENSQTRLQSAEANYNTALNEQQAAQKDVNNHVKYETVPYSQLKRLKTANENLASAKQELDAAKTNRDEAVGKLPEAAKEQFAATNDTYTNVQDAEGELKIAEDQLKAAQKDLALLQSLKGVSSERVQSAQDLVAEKTGARDARQADVREARLNPSDNPRLHLGENQE